MLQHTKRWNTGLPLCYIITLLTEYSSNTVLDESDISRLLCLTTGEGIMIELSLCKQRQVVIHHCVANFVREL